MANGYLYLFRNYNKHGESSFGDGVLDLHSSAWLFEGWDGYYVTFDERESGDGRSVVLRPGLRGAAIDATDRLRSRPTIHLDRKTRSVAVRTRRASDSAAKARRSSPRASSSSGA